MSAAAVFLMVHQAGFHPLVRRWLKIGKLKCLWSSLWYDETVNLSAPLVSENDRLSS